MENKTDPAQKDADYLKQQFEKSDSPESKILVRGYAEIVNKYEVKQEEKALIQDTINSLEPPYNRLSGNENLKNLISRNFDINKNEMGDVILFDHKNSAEKINNPAEAIQKFLDQQIPEIKDLAKED